MTFEKAGILLSASFKKYGLSEQVSGALVCEKSRNIFAEQFPVMAEYWLPKKFVDSVLYIAVDHASAKSKLFLETQNILEIFKKDTVLKNVTALKIVRLEKEVEEF